MAFDWRGWVSDRFGLYPLKKTLLDRRVGKTPWYYGDGATLLLLLGVLVATGPFMALSYSPSPDLAYQSVRYLTDRQILGGFLRAMHYWSAGLMVVVAIFHLLRQVLVAGYKFPREGTWLVGVLLLAGVLTMSFTGYVLRWDERGVYALRVLLSMVGHVPFIGDPLVTFIQGGTQIGAPALSRTFAVHAVFGPLLMVSLAAFHLYLVVLHGVTSLAERDRPIHTADEQRRIRHETKQSSEHSEPFYPDAMARSGVMALGVFLLVLVLALTLGPPELYPAANLIAPSRPIEEWWFWWYSALIALFPPLLAPALEVLLPIVFFSLLIALPFLDRSPFRGIKRRPLAVAVVIVSTLLLVGLSALRMRSPWTGWPRPDPPPVPQGVVLPTEAEQGRLLFARYGCNSCHSVAGVGPDVGTDLARLAHRYSRAELRRYILEPPRGVSMPSFDGRLSDRDLERLVAFVLVAQTFPRMPH